MSRRKKTPDPKSKQAERGAPPRRRELAPLPEVVLARRRPVSEAPSEVAAAEAPSPSVGVEPASEEPAKAKRSARIVTRAVPDSLALRRADLLSRVLDSNGSGPITRAVNGFRKEGFEFPAEQAVQLKLLEHADESEVRGALDVLAALLDEQAPIQLPIFEQRLKRLEEDAESAETRERAAELRRALRS